MWHQVLISMLLFQGYYWGVDLVTDGPLREPIPLLFNAIFSCWLFMEAFRVPLGHDKNSKTFGVLSRLFLIVSFASVALAIYDRSVGGMLAGSPLPPESIAPGLLLALLGIYLRHVSISSLGRFFVTKVQVTHDHQLVTEGIYRVLRHPSYTGLLLGFTGTLIMLGSGLGLLLFLLVGIPAYVYRIRVEENALLDTFGDNYRTYKTKSYALIPYVY